MSQLPTLPIRSSKVEARRQDPVRGEVVHVDEELGWITVQVLGGLTVDAGTVQMVRKYRRPPGTTPLHQKVA
jgi:hypothetical protein